MFQAAAWSKQAHYHHVAPAPPTATPTQTDLWRVTQSSCQCNKHLDTWFACYKGRWRRKCAGWTRQKDHVMGQRQKVTPQWDWLLLPSAKASFETAQIQFRKVWFFFRLTWHCHSIAADLLAEHPQWRALGSMFLCCSHEILSFLSRNVGRILIKLDWLYGYSAIQWYIVKIFCSGIWILCEYQCSLYSSHNPTITKMSLQLMVTNLEMFHFQVCDQASCTVPTPNQR